MENTDFSLIPYFVVMMEELSISNTAKLKMPIASTDLVKVVRVHSSDRSRLRCIRKYQNRINLEDYRV